MSADPQSVTYRLAELRRFVTAVWAPGWHALGIQATGEKYRHVNTYDSPDAWIAAAEKFVLGDFHVWLMVNGMAVRPPLRGYNTDITSARALSMDLDYLGPPGAHDSTDLPTEERIAKALVGLGEIAPNLVVRTGWGFQPHWRLSCDIDPERRQGLLFALAARLQELEPQLTVERLDLAGMFRVPGSTNIKVEGDPRPVVIDHWAEGPGFTPEYLERRCPPVIVPVHGGGGRHVPGPVTEAQRALLAYLKEHHGGHGEWATRDGQIRVCSPHKPATAGHRANIWMGDDDVAVCTVFSPNWPELGPVPPEQYRSWALRFDEKGLCHPSDMEARVSIEPTQGQAIGDYQARAEAEKAALVDGATFVLDQSVALVTRWGRGDEVLWAHGESLMLCGPTGVGKTTIAGQVVGGLIGVLPNVLGYPVLPAKKVLYLAMDRPRQIQRALRRLFGPAHRQALAEHLVVRRGPLPGHLVRDPEILARLAAENGCDVIVADSAKDLGVKLSDEEGGIAINTAIQFCNAADVDVLLLHHQRKSVEGHKPTKLEDVYGSTWLTAGAGSVILLWGDAGSESVELSHLKQPLEMVGPLIIEHDHHAGTSTVVLGWDALAYLQMRGAAGATISEAAQAHHSAPQTSGGAKWKRTERRLKALVRKGLASFSPGVGVGQPGRFLAVMPVAVTSGAPVPQGGMPGLSMDTSHGRGTGVRSMDASMDTP